MGIKDGLKELLVFRYKGEEIKGGLLIAMVLGIIWGILSLSLNYRLPIPVSPIFLSNHPLRAAWMFLPTKIAAYIIVLFVDLFRFVYFKLPNMARNIYVLIAFIILSPIIGAKIITALYKGIRRVANAFDEFLS